MRIPSALADAVDDQYAANEAAIEALRSGDSARINQAIVDLEQANAKRLRLTHEEIFGHAHRT